MKRLLTELVTVTFPASCPFEMPFQTTNKTGHPTSIGLLHMLQSLSGLCLLHREDFGLRKRIANEFDPSNVMCAVASLQPILIEHGSEIETRPFSGISMNNM